MKGGSQKQKAKVKMNVSVAFVRPLTTEEAAVSHLFTFAF
jgi:hypothetical protein